MKKRIFSFTLFSALVTGALLTSCGKQEIVANQDQLTVSEISYDHKGSIEMSTPNGEHTITLNIESDSKQGLEDMKEYYSYRTLHITDKNEALAALSAKEEISEEDVQTNEKSYKVKVQLDFSSLKNDPSMKGKLVGFKLNENSKTLSSVHTFRPATAVFISLDHENGILFKNKTIDASQGFFGPWRIVDNAIFRCTHPLGSSNTWNPPYTSTPNFDTEIMDYNQIYDLNPANNPMGAGASYGVTAFSLHQYGGSGYNVAGEYYIYL